MKSVIVHISGAILWYALITRLVPWRDVFVRFKWSVRVALPLVLGTTYRR